MKVVFQPIYVLLVLIGKELQINCKWNTVTVVGVLRDDIPGRYEGAQVDLYNSTFVQLAREISPDRFFSNTSGKILSEGL